MRLLLDEHISHRIADELRRGGHDVTAVAERPDLRGRPDEELIEVALTEGRTLATFDIADHVGIYSSSRCSSRGL
jgi:predicted nuclease of predicted toxin-antitoxin system